LQRGDDRVEHDGELIHAAGDDAGDCEREQPAHVWIKPGRPEGEAHSRSCRGDRHDDHLQDSRGGNAPGKRYRRVALPDVADRNEREQNEDEHNVEQARRESRNCKTAERVQHAGIERHHRHAEEKGERDAGKQDGKLELGRIFGKARRQQQHEPGHGELAKEREHHEDKRQSSKGLLGEGTRRCLSALTVKSLGEQRNEGRIEGSLREQAAEQVRHAEGDEESVGHGAGAEHGGD
jgi:hypothetical protein